MILIKHISLDAKKYTIYEADEDKSVNEMKHCLGVSDLAVDSLIVPTKVKLESTTTCEVCDAWHVEALDYESLPQKYSGQGITIAVIDSGVEFNHPALSENMWINKDEIPSNGIDDDNNGFVDDVHGFNFHLNNADIIDTGGHGTHVAGIIAAKPGPHNAQGIAPSARIMAVKIRGNSEDSFVSQAVEAIKYSVDNGADIVQISWVFEDVYVSELVLNMFFDAIDYAQNRGVIIVAAAGNLGVNLDTVTWSNFYPAMLSDRKYLVSVASSNREGDPAWGCGGTNTGEINVLFAAPGCEITSTYVNGKWGVMSGSSMAAPIVSGILARSLSMGLSPHAAIKLLSTTSDIDNSWKGNVGSGGVINANRNLDTVIE